MTGSPVFGCSKDKETTKQGKSIKKEKIGGLIEKGPGTLLPGPYIQNSGAFS